MCRLATESTCSDTLLPYRRLFRSDSFERAAEGLRSVGLGQRLSHYPGQLSGGEQQRVALARAFAASPDIILADEPTGNLDGETGRQIIELMFGLSRARGATLVLITHDPALADRCDRVVRLVDGLIVDDGTAAGADRLRANN